MNNYFDIYGTPIEFSSIKDFRVIDVEFVFRPVYHEVKKTMLNTISGKKFEFLSMEPYAAIIGQQGHKSALGEYKPKDFKESISKDISGAVIYTLADKLKLKAFKHQKYHCMNLAGRVFTTYLDDIPVQLMWNDGRIAEIFKEDPLYGSLIDNAPPGIKYISALIISAGETFCFFGNDVQIHDALSEYERLKLEIEYYREKQQSHKLLGNKEKIVLPLLPKLSLPKMGSSSSHKTDNATSDE